MSIYNKIIKNAFANGIGFATEAIIAFCMLPYIIHRIGESAYGVWALTLSLTGYVGLLNLGLRPAINKYVAQYNILNEKDKIKELIHTSLLSYSICALLMIIISSVVALKANAMFNIPQEFKNDVPLLIFIVGIQMSIGLLAVVYGGVISGMQRYEINNGIEIFVMISRTLIIIVFLSKFPNIFTIAIAHFSTTIIGYIMTVFAARRIADIKRINLFRKPSISSVKSLLKFSAITFIIGIVGRIMSYIDSILIASFLTTSVITYYVIGSRLVKYTSSLVGVLVQVLAPAASELNARDGNKAVKYIYIYSSKICCLITFPILLFLIIQGKDFLFLWMGKNYENSYQVMLILSLAGFLTLPQSSTVPILYGLAKHNIIMWLSIIQGLFSILIATYLGQKYGLWGIAIGLSSPNALLSGIFYPIYLSKMFGFRLVEYLFNCYFKSILSTLPILAILLFFNHLQIVKSWPMFCAEMVICILLHIISVLALGLSQEEKRNVVTIIDKIPMGSFFYKFITKH